MTDTREIRVLGGVEFNPSEDRIRFTFYRPEYEDRIGHHIQTPVKHLEWELTGTELLDILEGRK